jgi:hypothetical protein
VLKRFFAYFIQTTTNIDGRRLDDVVDDVRKGCQKVRRIDLRVEEDFRSEESFVADINGIFLSRCG